jgi:hypothetical protein
MKWQKYWRNVKIIMAKNGGNENNNGEMKSANQCGGWRNSMAMAKSAINVAKIIINGKWRNNNEK